MLQRVIALSPSLRFTCTSADMGQHVDFYRTFKLYYMLMEFLLYLNIVIANTEMKPFMFLDLYVLLVSVLEPCPGASKSTIRAAYTVKRKEIRAQTV